MKNALQTDWNRLALALTLAAAGLSLPSAPDLGAASFTDPATTFYGKIVGTAGERPFLVTQGTLEWTIRRADGANVTLSSQLFPLREGEFSYRLEVPHEVLASGLTHSLATVPVGPLPETHAHHLITVDGFVARILGPGGAAFDLAQAWRASAYRLDLEVPLDAVDSDGDGLPDWWEEQYGLNDGTGDPDGDGLNNRNEFLNGSDPGRDDRAPSLATREIRVFGEGATALWLRAVDADSESEQLRYTLLESPGLGQLYLRNAAPSGEAPDRPLANGDSFTQDDVDQGRVVFAHDGDAGQRMTRLVVVLRDEDAGHAATTNEVWMNVYRPGQNVALADPSALASGERLRWPRLVGVAGDEHSWAAGYFLGRDAGFHIRDAFGGLGSVTLLTPSSAMSAAAYAGQYIPAHGPDKSHVLLGGQGDDVLVGGMERDVLVGGPGHDSLRGQGGGDLFAFDQTDSGHDILEDFNPEEGDVIDLSRVLNGGSARLTDYLRVADSADGCQILVDGDGAGGDTDLTLTLAGVTVAEADLHAWTESGALETGDKQLAPRLSIVATTPVASENDAAAGVVTLVRSGDSAAWLTVNLFLSGSAINGVDYQYVDAQVSMPAGVMSLDIPIVPYVDTLTELAEIVDVRVQAGAGYDVGSPAVARISIEDLAPSIGLEVLEPVAVKSTLRPAYLLITRSGVLDRSVFVRLNIGGSAANGIDYESLPAFINFAAGQTSLLLPITPKSSGSLAGGAESVILSIRPDASYRVSIQSQAALALVDTLMTFVGWMQSEFPGVNEPAETFAGGDYGDKGVRNLTRYAYWLDPLAPETSKELMPAFQMRDGRFAVVFRRPVAISDLEYIVEVSEDMRLWQSGPDDVEPFFPIEHAGDLNVVGYRSTRSTEEAPRQFMRVRVRYTP